MAGALYFPPRALEQNSSGAALGGALLYTYEVGTTTNKSTYTTSALSVAHANPVVADSAGRFAAIYLDGSYKFVLKDSAGATIWTEDNVTGIGAGSMFSDTVAITSTTSIDSTHDKTHLRITGTTTLNLLLAATATEGYSLSLQNDGTGLVTIDPNGSEQVNDTTTWVVPPGGGGILVCDGSEWSFIGTMGIVQSLAAGDILYLNSDKKLARLAIGADDNRFLSITSAVPAWKSVTATAQTVLDDSTTAAMLTTLGAASLITNTFTGAQIGTATALTSTSNSIAINLATNNNFSHTFTESTTLANPSNAVAGQSGMIAFTQHASSAKTLAFGSNWKEAITGTAPAVSTTVSTINVLTYYVVDATNVWYTLNKGGVA